MPLPSLSRQVHLTRRPATDPAPADFTVASVPVPELAEGEVLVRNTHLGLGAVMRGLILGTSAPLPPYPVDAALFGPAVGEVIDSASPALRPGQRVRHQAGWRDLSWGPASGFTPIDETVLSDPVAHLLPGPVAYVGLAAVGGVRAGDTVLVTGAAGSVGSLAGQIARLLGAARVIGTAGSPEKAAWAERTLGYDQVLDYRDPGLPAALSAAAPDGLDVVFDTVGGTQLQAAISIARPRARFALCGALASQFGDGHGGVELDLMSVIGKRLTLAGFTPADHPDLVAAWPTQLANWLADGQIVPAEHRVDGLDAAVGALLDLFAGRTRGTVVVHLDNADH
ncbi:NADP-dependent oxidoreductase [Amycolatopsis cynarae]|uniref:NADP-dependent oxidoreductase n=1 Tax=Amycolatopsis cynarae TaxID=2995223 RepID=A0ABY7BCR4_9PSEU|nr:NADP-dependent oxidoreductase [Amycolatopsis sp. HUAS 11-8]WAL68686.1 NADP-dependent oxidoreductase [Amycolatopsis sp. HUAS 11-8]